MKPTALVATTVHWPDDTRIRERLIRTLVSEFNVVYASRSPGPSDLSDLHSMELKGGRIMRNLRVLTMALKPDWDVLILHDPETIPIGLLARLVRRKPVVFDVHENVPATAMTRVWVPRLARRPLAGFLSWLLHFAERYVEVTLAEPGYQSLFKGEHPVFVNYPDTSDYPDLHEVGDGGVVYLGDVTLERGADVASRACERSGLLLTFIGRAPRDLREALLQAHGSGVEFAGALPNPLALRRVATASIAVAPLRDIPNYRYSQPTKILEYLALGVPVVASDLPGVRELVDGLDAVFLTKPGDSESLADAIELAQVPIIRETAQSQAASIRNSFRWPAASVRDFYTSLV